MSRTAAVACGLMLLSTSSLSDASSAAARQLLRQHPLFGKCTVDDFAGLTGADSFSFLQEETASQPSDEECRQLLVEHDSLFASGVADAVAEDEQESKRITDSSTAEEAVALAAELLRKESAEGDAVELKSLRRSMALFSKAAKDSTIIVLGLGLPLHSFAKMAKNVIAVETDYTFCREFLSSKVGGCTMQPNVHIYCVQPASSDSKDDAETSQMYKYFGAAQDLIDDLMKQQFGDVPASAVAVLGSFAVTKLMLMGRFLDQSSVILTRSRMSSEGLSAVSESFRVISSFGPNHRSPSHSTKTLMLLQRLFVPPSHGDKWTVYTTPEWEMRDNTAPLTLWNTVREAIEQFVSDESVSLWKRQALLGYMDAYAYAAVTGSDEDWKDVTSALEAILDSVGRGKKADSVLEEASSSALRLTRKVANASGLQEYLQLLLDAHSGIDSDDKPFIHAQICGLVAETGRLIASPNTLDKVKDAIEEACELSEKNHQLLLPALRLIRGGIARGEEDMVERLRILVKLKDGVPGVDVSALVEEAGK